MVKAKILHDGDEVEAYRSIRYVFSSEAIWKMFAFQMQMRRPGVELLFVHFQGEQPVVHDEADTVIERRNKAAQAISKVMIYFARPRTPEIMELSFL